MSERAGVATVEAEAARSDAPVTRRRVPWLVAFVGFFLLVGAWSVAEPYDGTPDEHDHIIRAYGVAAGQVVVEPAQAIRNGGAFTMVPRSLVKENACWRFRPTVSAACAEEPGGDRTLVRAATGAGRYHPIYYGLVGWPLVVSPDWTGVLLARLLSAAWVAALLATALVDALRWSRHRVMMAGVIAAATPMAAHIGGAINPNGVEIASGVALFAAAIPLLLHPDAARNRTLLWHAGVAALGLAVFRAGGPLWLVISLGALLVGVRWARLRELWQWRAVRWWAAGVGAAMAASVAWTLALKTTYMGDFTRGQRVSAGQAIRMELERWRQYTDEIVGVTAWLDTRLPAPGFLLWQYAVAALLGIGILFASTAGRWRMATLFVAGAGIPFAMQIAYANTYGFVTQGRYLLPVLVGLPVLAAYLAGDGGLGADRCRSLIRLCAVVFLPLHLLFLGYTMVRFQGGIKNNRGLASLNPLAGTWHPPLGSAVPVLMAVVGTVILGWFLWTSRPDRLRACTEA